MNRIDHSDCLLRNLIHFICAGSSALMLSLAYSYTDFWFIYLFALLPFLHRVVHTDFRGSIVSGLFLALSLLFVVFSSEAFGSPGAFISEVLFLCLTFVLFSAVINRLKKYVILSFLLSAALCFTLGYFNNHYFEFDAVPASLRNNAGFAFRATSLLGFIFVAFIIISFNSLLLFILDILCRLAVLSCLYWFGREYSVFLQTDDRAYIKHWKSLPSFRGPPNL